MRLGSIKYLTKEGLKNILNNKLMTMASIGVLLSCLLITGAAVLFSANIKASLKEVEHKNNFTVYLDTDLSSIEAIQVGEKINKVDNIISCEFFSKEEAIEKYKDVLGTLFDGLQGDDNPMPDAYHIAMDDLSRYDETVNNIKSISGVDSVGDKSGVAETIVKLDRLVSMLGLCMVLILSAVSLFIVSNTIKVTMYSRRLEISIMKSVGATDGFIRVPFIVEGVVIGLISALIATICLSGLYQICMELVTNIIPISRVDLKSIILPISLSFAVSGILFGLVGGLISIGKYLKKEGRDIIAF